MTQLNESMEFNSPQPFFGVTTNQLSYFIGSFWSTKDTPDGLKPSSRHPTPTQFKPESERGGSITKMLYQLLK